MDIKGLIKKKLRNVDLEDFIKKPRNRLTIDRCRVSDPLAQRGTLTAIWVRHRIPVEYEYETASAWMHKI